MEIIRKQLGDPIPSVWHLQIGGVAADGKYRLAAIDAECDDPDEWLTTHEAEAQVLIDTGKHDPIRETRPDFDELSSRASAEIDWLDATIPNVDTMTGEEVRGVVKRLAQENLQTIKAWRYILRRLW